MRTLILLLALCGSVAQAAPTIDSKPLYSIDYPARSSGLTNDTPTRFAWSPDGKTLATGGENAALHFWDAKTGKHKAGLAREFSSTYDISYSPDGKLFAIGTSQLVGVSLWDARTGKLVRTLKRPYPSSKDAHIFNFAWAPDGKILVSSQGKDLRFWNVKTEKKWMQVISVSHGSYGAVVASPDGKRLATAIISGYKANEPTQTRLSLENFRDDQTDRGEHTPQDAGSPLAWTPDGSRLFTRMVGSANDNRVGQWFLDKNIFRPTSTDEITANGSAAPFALAPDGKTFALGRKDGTIRLRQSRGGELLQTLNTGKAMVMGLKFSPDGSMLAGSTNDGQLKMWRVRS